MNDNDGGSAFPGQLSEHDIISGGMTLRDYFAAAAMNAMIACQDFTNEVITKEECASKEEVCESIARWSYMYADAMLAARRGEE